MEKINPRQLIEALIHPSTPLRQEAAWQSLLELGEAGDDEVVAYFLRFDYESDDWSYLQKAIEKMDDAFLEKIAEGLQYSEHQSGSSDLFEMIEEMGQPAVPYLIQIMNEESNGEFSAEAATALGKIGGAVAAEALARAVEEMPEHFDTDSVMDALAELGDESARNILIASITSDHEDTRTGAIWAMRGCPGPEFIEPLARALRDYDDYREGIVDSLAEIIDPGVVPVLESLLEGESGDVQRAAKRALGSIKKRLAHLKRHTGPDGEKHWALALPPGVESDQGELAFELSEPRVAAGVFSGTVKNVSQQPFGDMRFELDYLDHENDVIKTDTRWKTDAKFTPLEPGESQTFSIHLDVPDDCYDIRLQLFEPKPKRGPRSNPKALRRMLVIVWVILISLLVFGFIGSC